MRINEKNKIKTDEYGNRWRSYDGGKNWCRTYINTAKEQARYKKERKEKEATPENELKILLRQGIKETTYKWQGTPEQLHALYKKMNGIYFETDENNFKVIFSLSKYTLTKPIQLKKRMTNRLLTFFLISINDLNLIQKCIWQNIAGKGKLFKNYKGKIINVNDLSVAKVDIHVWTGNKPKGYDEINKLLQEIKNIK